MLILLKKHGCQKGQNGFEGKAENLESKFTGCPSGSASCCPCVTPVSCTQSCPEKPKLKQPLQGMRASFLLIGNFMTGSQGEGLCLKLGKKQQPFNYKAPNDIDSSKVGSLQTLDHCDIVLSVAVSDRRLALS